MLNTKNSNMLSVVIIVALVSMIGPFTIDTYLPSFQSIEADFSVNRALLSQSIAFYLIATAIFSLFWGPLSDRLGRKYIIIGSLFLYSVASVGCAFSTDYSQFLMFRVLQGVGASGGMVAGRAMVRDIYDSNNAQRVMAYVMMLFALAPAIAPIIGGWLHELFGWRSIFYFLCAYGVSMLLFSSFTLKESLQASDQQSFHPFHVIRIYAKTLLHIRFLSIVMTLSFSFGGMFVYIAGAPSIIFDFLSLSSTHFWLLFLPITVGVISGAFLAGKLIKSWSTIKIVNMAFVFMIVAIIINMLQANYFEIDIFWVILPIVIYAFAMALSMPGLGILALDCFPDNKGAASAVQSFMQIMMSGLVAGVMLPVITQSVSGFALLQMVLLGISLLFWAVTLRSTKA
ncbi:MAG: multidrug effflux MFS transporter [Gammaproteobacteria bacterium]|nr:multidrug effflux MFS transporter [Gammaproteobacteria bacterium]